MHIFTVICTVYTPWPFALMHIHILHIRYGIYIIQLYCCCHQIHNIACSPSHTFLRGVSFQGYISIGLEERLKYLRRPQKRPQKECPSATDVHGNSISNSAWNDIVHPFKYTCSSWILAITTIWPIQYHATVYIHVCMHMWKINACMITLLHCILNITWIYSLFAATPWPSNYKGFDGQDLSLSP